MIRSRRYGRPNPTDERNLSTGAGEMMTLDYVTTVPAHLVEQLAAGAQRARAQRGPVLVSLTEHIPWQDAITFFERGRELAADRVFWEQPNAGWALVGVGAAQTFAASGPDRFA